MKRFLFFLLGIIFIQPVHADDFAKLRMKISGVSQNKYYLCLNTVGCVSIHAGNHGTVYPMNAGSINYIIPVNAANLRLHQQTLPKSCEIDVKPNQTVTITGRLESKTKDQIYITHLKCTIG